MSAAHDDLSGVDNGTMLADIPITSEGVDLTRRGVRD